MAERSCTPASNGKLDEDLTAYVFELEPAWGVSRANGLESVCSQARADSVQPQSDAQR